MADHGLKAFLLPDGVGELVAVACDDTKLGPFRIVARAAQRALGLQFKKLEDRCEVQAGSLGSRAKNFDAVLIRAITEADQGRNVERHCFDRVTVTSGPMRGLRGLGIGSTNEKRQRAFKAALVIAATQVLLPAGMQRPTISGSLQQFLQYGIHVEGVNVQGNIVCVAADMRFGAAADGSESQDAPSENGHDVGQAVFEQANDARQEQPAVPALEPEDDDDRWSTLAYRGVLNQFDPPKSEIQWMLVD